MLEASYIMQKRIAFALYFISKKHQSKLMAWLSRFTMSNVDVMNYNAHFFWCFNWNAHVLIWIDSTWMRWISMLTSFDALIGMHIFWFEKLLDAPLNLRMEPLYWLIQLSTCLIPRNRLNNIFHIWQKVMDLHKMVCIEI